MDGAAITNVLRWFHLGAGAAWLGEVVAVVFVLVPILLAATGERRAWFLSVVFPRVFRLASVLSATAVLAGAGLYVSINGVTLEPLLTGGRWGTSILVGGGLGLGLTLFHFVAEGRLEPLARSATDEGFDDALLVRRLRIVPRVGLAVLVVVFGAMMFAARGL